MLTKEQAKKYLQRIEYEQPVSADEETLSALQWHHLTHIPYENIDLLAGNPLSLKSDDLYNKIILNGRGGYCFELQGLFKELLEYFSFNVTQYAARFLDEGPDIQMRRHRILTVNLKGCEYLVDVGVRSESPRKALKIIYNEVQSDGISEYKFENDKFFGTVLLQKERNKNWKQIYGFTHEIQTDIDYIMPSFYCEKNEESTFNKYMKISIFKDKSNFTIVNGVFKEYKNAEVCLRKELKTKKETAQYLEKYFNLKNLPLIPNS
ncbi:MAG: arylamine N-acetyltransferase [Clostridia bacterium]|nr:arylamine N-acetyltransferase [Clostridia bacterium]